MSKDIIEKMGVVQTVLPNARFKVKLADEDRIIDAYLSGKIRLNHIKVQEGDVVKIEINAYDISRGRITFREKKTY